MTDRIWTQGQTIRQVARCQFHNLIGSNPSLVQVLSGKKQILGAGKPVTVREGEFALMPDDMPLTIENIVGENGMYTARSLMIDRRLFDRAYARMPDLNPHIAPVQVGISKLPRDAVSVYEQFFDLREDMVAPPEILELRKEEIATWLAVSGIVLGVSAPLSLGTRLRKILCEDPAGEWSANRAAALLAVSPPTLRRHLARECTSFSEILRDVRLTHGLALLQVTDFSIARVAAESGYASASQFARRFRERFSVLPSAIRGEDALIDRIGA